MKWEAARDILRHHPIDALVTEQYVAGKSSVDFCMSILAKYPKLVKIVMADSVTKEVVEAKRRRGINIPDYDPRDDSGFISIWLLDFVCLSV